MIIPIRNLGNKFSHNSANMTSDSKMNLTSSEEMKIDNYNDVRGWAISSNKLSSRMVSISSSEISVDYTTRMKRLNNLPDFFIIKEPIDSSQLSYAAIGDQSN